MRGSSRLKTRLGAKGSRDCWRSGCRVTESRRPVDLPAGIDRSGWAGGDKRDRRNARRRRSAGVGRDPSVCCDKAGSGEQSPKNINSFCTKRAEAFNAVYFGRH